MKTFLEWAKLALIALGIGLGCWWLQSDSFRTTVAVGADVGMTVLKWLLILTLIGVGIWGIENIIADGVAKGIARAAEKAKQ
jgi:hypothetical protein